jgi:hypothetical protein
MWLQKDILDLFVKGKITDHIFMEQVWLSMLIIKLRSFLAHRISKKKKKKTLF